jgi:uncharacterized protein (TIGR00730 family)
MPIIVVFGSGDTLKGSFEYDTAELAGKLLAESGFDIATGGYMGVMEAVHKGSANQDIKRIGVVNSEYSTRFNDYVNEKIETNSYIDRLLKLVEIGDAYIVLPGGTGTLLELSMVWALRDRGLINKPIVAIGEQWGEVFQTMGFYSERILEKSFLVEQVDDIEEAVKFLNNYFGK